MAGYNGQKMSWNAVHAYEDGEMPLSKWTKTKIVDAIRKAVSDGTLSLQCNIEMLNKMPAEMMRDVCLCRSSWHHTGKYFSETNFYSVDFDKIRTLTDDMICDMVAEYKEKRKHADGKFEKWECSFLIWSGTRHYPKAKRMTEIGIIKGNWFIRPDGSRKNINSTGFEKMHKID